MKLPGTIRLSELLHTSTIRLFSIGAISILGQVVLLRELSVAFYGVELIYTLAIGTWLIFNGLGTMVGLRRKSESPAHADYLFILLSVAIPVAIAFIRSARLIFFGTPGAFLPLHVQILATTVSLLPFGIFLGLLFRWTAREYIRKGRSLTAAYAVESCGGIAGGLCATLFLKLGIQNFDIALICALLAVLSAFLPAPASRSRPLRYAAAAVTAACFVCLFYGSALDRAMTSWTHPDLVITRDSPYSRITVTRRQQQTVVFENDTLLFDSEGIQTEEFVHLAALQDACPRRVLVLGGGIEGIIAEIRAHKPDSIDYVELNPVLLDIARRELPRKIGASLDAANVRVIIADPRRYLETAPEYDLIISGMPEPSSGQANRFYTLEFFRQCAARLKPSGILAFRLPASENYLSLQRTLRMKSVFLAARNAFPEILVLPATSDIFLCSKARLTDDPALLASRLHDRHITSGIITASYIRYLFTNNRFLEITEALHKTPAPVNTDVVPVCYRYSLAIWLSKFMPSLIRWDFAAFEKTRYRSLCVVLALALAIPAIFLWRTRWNIRRAVITGIAGFAGMTLETVLLLRFQIKNGILFQDIGILLTGFMLGLVLGAVSSGKAKHPLPATFGIAISAGFLLLSAFIGTSMHSSRIASLPATFLLLMLSGFLVAGTFAFAGLREPKDQGKTIVPLYAADLIGGGLGSILISLVAVPFAGLSASIFLIIPLALLSGVLILKA